MPGVKKLSPANVSSAANVVALSESPFGGGASIPTVSRSARRELLLIGRREDVRQDSIGHGREPRRHVCQFEPHPAGLGDCAVESGRASRPRRCRHRNRRVEDVEDLRVGARAYRSSRFEDGLGQRSGEQQRHEREQNSRQQCTAGRAGRRRGARGGRAGRDARS